MTLYEVLLQTLQSVVPEYPPPIEMNAKHLHEIMRRVLTALVPWQISRTPTAGELRSLGYDLALNPNVKTPDIDDDAELILNIGVSPAGDSINFTAAFRMSTQKQQESASAISQRQTKKKGLTKQQRRELLDEQ